MCKVKFFSGNKSSTEEFDVVDQMSQVRAFQESDINSGRSKRLQQALAQAAEVWKSGGRSLTFDHRCPARKKCLS